MTLFQTGDFTLASGQKSRWKLECDALTADDWAGLAAIAAEILPPFGAVLGVPRGGLPLAKAMEPYVTSGPTLVVDDVFTTGGSIRRFIAERGLRNAIGLVAFARNVPDEPWVTALFQMGGKKTDPTDEEALAWIRRKLELPPDAQMFAGAPTTIAGQLHVLCSRAHGYETYIKAHKCDDKEGEIARLTVENRRLQEENDRLRGSIPMASVTLVDAAINAERDHS